MVIWSFISYTYFKVTVKGIYIGTLTEHTIFDHFADVCFTRAYYIYYKDSSKTVNEFACTPNEVST